MRWYLRSFCLSVLSVALTAVCFGSTVQSPPAARSKRSTRHVAVRPRRVKQVKNVPPQPPPPPPTPEQLPATAPRVSYQQGQLTIASDNSTLGSILSAVRTQTGAAIDIPPGAAGERIATRLGPAPAADVLAKLLNGSRYDFIILGADDQPGAVTSIMLRPKAGGTAAPAAAANATPPGGAVPPPAGIQPGESAEQQTPPDTEPDQGEIPDDTVQPPPAEQPEAQQPEQPQPEQPQPEQPQPEQPQEQTQPGQPQQPNGVKTPEQLLQELQRMQQQQQQQPPPPPQ